MVKEIASCTSNSNLNNLFINVLLCLLIFTSTAKGNQKADSRKATDEKISFMTAAKPRHLHVAAHVHDKIFCPNYNY